MLPRTRKLNNGVSIPSLGLGTWKSQKNLATGAVTFAITKAGYRHIDCASIYGNEIEIGNAFKNIVGSFVPRDELFITSKLWNTDHRPENVEKACKKTLSDLQLDYLDLYLIHWGIAFKDGGDLEPLDENGRAITDTVPIRETWQAMEELVKKGLVKSIGVANFTTIMLVDLLTYANILPVMNQVELHPYNTQQELLAYCGLKNITVTAYSPLGRQGEERKGSRLFDETLVKQLANKYGKTPAQILLNWAIGRGTIAIPKSVTPERIAENIAIFEFELSQEEKDALGALNLHHRFVNPIEWWGIPYFE